MNKIILSIVFTLTLLTKKCTVSIYCQEEIISTIAGNGTAGYSGDGGPAIDAELYLPTNVALYNGDVYIADYDNNVIRKVFTNGIIVTFAGNGTAGYSGDGGPAIDAELYQPYGIAVAVNGDVYFSDSSNHAVRKVFTNGTIITVAGNGTAGYSGDGGPAIDAEFSDPAAISIDPLTGDLYIADFFNSVIRKVFANGTIITFAGNGTAGYSGDGGPAIDAELYHPYGAEFDVVTHSVYIADSFNNVIRKVFANGTIITFAGNGTAGYSGDGGPAIDAELHVPASVSIDPLTGDLYIADTFNNVIRKVFANGTIITFAGNGAAGYSGDGGPATNATLQLPYGVTDVEIGPNAYIYIADTFSNVIRLVSPYYQCFGINFTDVSVCSGHGICSSPNNCTCNIGYTGLDCSIPICFNLNAGDINVCSGHGICESLNLCQCNVGYIGLECQFQILPSKFCVCEKSGRILASDDVN